MNDTILQSSNYSQTAQMSIKVIQGYRKPRRLIENT